MVKRAICSLETARSYHFSSDSRLSGRSNGVTVLLTTKSLAQREYRTSRSRRSGPSATRSPTMLRIGSSSRIPGAAEIAMRRDRDEQLGFDAFVDLEPPVRFQKRMDG